MGSLSTKLIEENKMEQAFALNDKIQQILTQIFGADSPFLEFQSQMLDNSLSKIIQ